MSPGAIAARLDTVRQLYRLSQYLTSFRLAEPEPEPEPADTRAPVPSPVPTPSG